MGITPDRFPGPAIEEEMRYEDRGPAGDNAGDPTFEGALRRVTHALRFFVNSTVRQILQVKNSPAGFEELDLNGVQDGDVLTYEGASKTLKPTTGGGGLTPTSHRNLDQLVHDVSENSFTEVNKTGSQVTSVVTWTDSGKTQKIREELYTYTAGKVTTIVTNQYDAVGALAETYTETVAYTGAQVDDITGVLT